MVPEPRTAARAKRFRKDLYPPVRFCAGRARADVDAILRANSRTPDDRGHLRGQGGVARLGERRLHESSRYGLETLLARRKLDRTETRMRNVLRSFPDGVAEATGYLEGDGSAGSEPAGYHAR